GKLDDAGGPAYLAEMANATPSTRNLLAYAKAIRNKALERSMIATGTAITGLGYDNTGMSIDEKIAEAQQAVMAIGETREEAALLDTNTALREWLDLVDRRFQGEETGGLMTGFADIDARTNGLKNQDLILIAGRPSAGKTAFAMNIAQNVAIEQRKPVLVFSMEMSGLGLWERLGASLAGIPLEHLARGTLRDEDWPKLSAAVQKAKNAPLYIDERAALSINQIQATARRLHRKQPLSLIVVDYLQLAKAKADGREREVGAISAGLKALAKELNLPLIALSQLNRDLEKRTNKRPINADLIYFLYRDEVYNENSQQKGICEAICSKFRNGKIGTDYLASRLEYSRFDTLSKPYQAPDPEPPRSRRGLDY
ncbi:MAG: replicative DNA helicase, partial [Spongiibacter sp.]|nr:replicative DNA helicase [Spongiibacter sp.]